MAKILYEGLRVGKGGGERWTGTIDSARQASLGRTGHPKASGGYASSSNASNAPNSKTPSRGSALSKPSHSKHTK